MAKDPLKRLSPPQLIIQLTKIVIALIFLPVLPVAVLFNIAGIADRLSIVPFIEDGGGIFSATVTLVMVGLVLVTAIGGAWALLGINIQVVGGDGPETPPMATTTDDKTPKTTITPKATATSIPTVSPTPKPELADLDSFKATYRSWLQRTMENRTLTGVPVLAMEYREMKDGTDELWVVYQECDGQEYAQDQRATVAVDFANVAGNFNGNQPDRLRAYGVQNLENFNHSITHIPTSSAEASFNQSMDRREYFENWADRMRTPTVEESSIAFQMAVMESGQAKAEEAFNEKYPLEESDRGCPDGAEPSRGS